MTTIAPTADAPDVEAEPGADLSRRPWGDAHSKHAAPPPIPPEERVPLKEKIAFGLGGVAGSVQIRADDYVLNPIFVVLYGISPTVMSTCAMLYRFWDAITDLLTGWLSDRARTRWGRRKPFIFVGSLLMSLAMPVLFFFDRSWSVGGIIAWMIGVQLTIFLFHSIWNIPYQCLLLESTPNSVERTNVAAWRGYVGVGAQAGMSWIWWATQLPIFNSVDGKPDVLYGTRWIFTGLAVTVLVLGFLPLFVKERTSVPTSRQPLPELSLWQNIKLTLTNRPFFILVLFTFLMSVSNTILWSTQFFVTLNYVFKGDTIMAATVGGIAGTVQTVLSIAGIPVFQWIARRFGKFVAVKLICTSRSSRGSARCSALIRITRTSRSSPAC